MQATTAPADIAFEASEADTSAWQAAIGWLPQYDLEHAIPEMIAFERSKSQVAPSSLGNVLVTSASKKVPLIEAVKTVARKLHPDIKVIAGDGNEHALARHVADGFWQMPPTNDAALEAIIAGCRERGIALVIPTRDGELAFWAKARAELAAAGIKVAVSPEKSVATCLDKLAFAAFGAAHGLPFIPAAQTPETIGPGPYVVKERFGAGSRGLGLDLTRDAALVHGAGLEAPIYQPFVTGDEISIDAWLDRHHRVKGLVLRRRELVVGGESQVTTTFRDGRLEAEAVRILEALKLSGPVVMQALVDAGHMAVIECNPRFGGASTTAIAAGLDVFYWTLLEAAGGDVDAAPFDRIAGEVRQIRVPSDIHVPCPGV